MSFERLIAKIVGLLPYKYIIFESNPDFSDNTKSVFDEMVRRNFNSKYKFIWVCKSNNSVKSNLFDCVYINDKIRRKYYMMRSKLIISCNTYLPKYTTKQIAIYLGHGIALKSMKTYKAPSLIDYFVGLSEDANRIMSQAFNCPINKFKITGYPRNDSLSTNKRNVLKQAFGSSFDKILVWYPTFRQHNNTKVAKATKSALPLINSEETIVRINEFAKLRKILIVLKPHFSQDLSYIKNKSLSNIVFINDSFFTQYNLTSYEFVGSCDGLITDYSSIYFDYLLCDKPIAAIWEDIDEYRCNRGFCIDIDYYMKGAIKVYDTNDFLKFLDEIAFGKDSLRKERNEINNLINKYRDNLSTKRVVDFIQAIMD